MVPPAADVTDSGDRDSSALWHSDRKHTPGSET